MTTDMGQVVIFIALREHQAVVQSANSNPFSNFWSHVYWETCSIAVSSQKNILNPLQILRKWAGPSFAEVTMPAIHCIKHDHVIVVCTVKCCGCKHISQCPSGWPMIFLNFRLEKKQMLFWRNLNHTSAAKHKFHFRIYTGWEFKLWQKLVKPLFFSEFPCYSHVIYIVKALWPEQCCLKRKKVFLLHYYLRPVNGYSLVCFGHFRDHCSP